MKMETKWKVDGMWLYWTDNRVIDKKYIISELFIEIFC